MDRTEIQERMKQNDIVVESWVDFMAALYDIPKNHYGRYRSNYVYRGVSDGAWHLETSLVRMGGEVDRLERALLRSFRKHAEPGSIPRAGLWSELAIAQHHGLPTRLLDWTSSPQVAVHFATAKNFDVDAAIWCVDVYAAHERLPQELRDILEAEYAYLFSVEMLDASDQIRSLDDFDTLAEHHPFALFFEPPALDARIVNQAAMLSVMPGVNLDLTEFLVRNPDLYKRIVIPSSLKWEVRDKLDQDYVTERTLFPGLDGLCSWLRRYYGRGPGHADRALRD
ncbi:MAG: FRG domain-containing protein [Acidobacteriota bacterium]